MRHPLRHELRQTGQRHLALPSTLAEPYVQVGGGLLLERQWNLLDELSGV